MLGFAKIHLARLACHELVAVFQAKGSTHPTNPWLILFDLRSSAVRLYS
jgi:hypothetical protein